MAAVEVDPAGCSYNPDYEQHQDAIAIAVAEENLMLIDRELAPKVCSSHCLPVVLCKQCQSSPMEWRIVVLRSNAGLSLHDM
jgi:hypothetical protein